MGFLDIESSCNNFTSGGSSVCTPSKITSGFGICVWKDNVCTEAKCEDLPLSLVLRQIVLHILQHVLLVVLEMIVQLKEHARYLYKERNMFKSDTIGTCTWDESVLTGTQIKGCRVKECQDAATTLINDSEYNTFIEG